MIPKRSGKTNGAYAAVDAMQIVNVASVPKRSPFRYPGGKTWLIPHVRKWLLSKNPRPTELIEPFAGGAIVGLTAAFERLSAAVTLVEKDQDVAAVWHTIFNTRQGAWLAERILSFRFPLRRSGLNSVRLGPAYPCASGRSRHSSGTACKEAGSWPREPG